MNLNQIEKQKISNWIGRFLALTPLVLVFTAFDAHAQSLGDVIGNTTDSLGDFPELLNTVTYILGAFLAVWGIFEFRKVADNPVQNSVKKPVLILLAAGLMISATSIAVAVQNTFVGGLSFAQYAGGGASGGGGGGGLDQIMLSFMTNIKGPMMMLISAFSFLWGSYLIVRGIWKLARAANDGWLSQGSNMTSLFGSFIIGGMLLGWSQMMGSFTGSLFGSATISNHAVLAMSGGSTIFVDRANEAIKAVIMFVQLVGWLSFLRGWFILKAVADGGGQASFQAGLTHIIGGAIAVNLVSLVGAIQTTLGLQAFTL